MSENTAEVHDKVAIKKMTLAEKLSFVMEQIGPICKKKQPGATVSYKYRSIDDVQNHLNPILSHYGITLQSKVIKYDLTVREFIKNETAKIAYCATVHLAIIFSDGKDIETWEEIAMSEDYADKALTQASSMAYKYALLRKFCITTEDLLDPDSRKPDYRDTEKDNDGPRPTAWLNEGTAQYAEVEAKLKSSEWSIEHVKTLYRVNAKQIPILSAMVGKSAAIAPTAGMQSEQAKSTPNPPS